MNRKTNAKRAVAGACLALFANMGMNSTFTVFLMTLISQWPEAQRVMLLPITVGCAMSFICSSFLIGPLMKKLSPRAIFLLCAGLAALYCLSYSFAQSYTVLIVASVFGGLVLSLGTHAMGVNAITPYFAEYGSKTSTVIGVVLASASLGAAVFSFAPGLISVTGSWRNAYLVIGAVVVLCDVIAFLIIPKPPKAAAAADPAAAASEAKALPGLSMGGALKTPAFWLVFFGILFMTIMYQGLCGHLPTFLKVSGMEETQANSMQGIMQFVGIFFVLFGGAIVTKIGVKGLILFAGLPLAVGCLLFGFVFQNMVAVWFAIICSVLCVTGAMILNICPVITPILFGAREMNRINAIYSGGVFWGAAAVAAQILNFAIVETVNGDTVMHYDRGFLLAVVFGAAGMICLFVSLAVNPMKKQTENA